MKKLLLLLCITHQTILPKKHSPPRPLFAHGLGDTLKQARNYNGVLFNITPISQPITFDFPDATRQFWRVNIAESTLGQQGDIDRLATVIHDRIAKNPTETFVGIGVSRGAAVWLSFMGIYGLNEVKALVLESPPDSMASAIKGLHMIAPLAFWKYDPMGMQPRDFIHTIPKDLPILLIGTKDDHLVPCTSTAEVYRLLQDSGHKNIHIFIFESGRHAKFVLGNHRTDYRNIVHAFYKKYGLPYNKKAAKQGKKLLEKTQPNTQEKLCNKDAT